MDAGADLGAGWCGGWCVAGAGDDEASVLSSPPLVGAGKGTGAADMPGCIGTGIAASLAANLKRIEC